jgi:hypothetical protein
MAGGLALAVQGCAAAGAGPADLPVREVTGQFTVGPASSWFRPCGAEPGDTLWWATFMGPAVAERDSLLIAGRLRAGPPNFLRVSAGVSEPRAAGADGRGTRFIYVRAILEARDPRANDCAAGGRP